MTAVDKMWRIILPVVVFLGINLTVQSIMLWYFVGVNIWESGGALSVSSQIMNENTILIMFLTMIITIPVMIVLMKKDEDRHSFRTFKEHFGAVDFGGFYLLVPLGICMCLGFTKLVTILPLDNILGSYEEILESYDQSNLAFRVLVLCILVPVAEELVYRGLFYKRIKEYYDKMIAVIVAAVVFGVVHMNLIQGLYAFLCAIVLLYIYDKYKSILAPIFLHMCINTMALVSGEFTVFDKINNTFISKLFFMLLEIAGVIGLLKVIWGKKKDDLT